MIIPAVSEIAFYVVSFPIYWYGITMALAILIAMILGNFLYNKVNDNFKRDIILENSPIIILLGILCARLYFCALNFNYYFFHPLQILDIRQGGLSIHGALLGGILAIFLISKKFKISIMGFLDALSCTTILGQSIGRWGNYFNSEAYGLPVIGQKWGLYIPECKRVSEYANYSLFHPTFLYESALDFIGFLILLYLFLKYGKSRKGLIFFVYLMIYSLIRFFIENIRVDSALNIVSIPIAKVVSIILFFIGLLGCVLTVKYSKRKDRV